MQIRSTSHGMLVITKNITDSSLYRSKDRDQLMHEDSLILRDHILKNGLSPDSSQAITYTENEGLHIVNVPKNKKEQLIKILVNIKYN
jgi:hypothetical protein